MYSSLLKEYKTAYLQRYLFRIFTDSTQVIWVKSMRDKNQNRKANYRKIHASISNFVHKEKYSQNVHSICN